ncbi:MAG: phage baseplate assembly protein V [Cyanobacteria bacterium P01_H01_bin.35]
MESIVGVMQKVAQQEASKIYTTELGIVTALFPHTSEDDKENYQCSIKLKNKKLPDGKDFELRQVPLITPHIGLVNIPNIGDLVLVTFIGGNINAPVIIGRLYNDEDLPPVNKPKEFLLQHNQKEGGKLKIDAEGVVTLTSKNEENEITIDDEKITAANEKCSVTLEGDDATLKNEKCQVSLAGGSVTIDNGSCKLTIESGGITIDAASSNVTVKSMGTIKIGDATTGSVQVGGRMPGNAVADNDQIILSTHTHVGNLGAPCPIMVPMEKINSIQAKARNTKVG